MESGGNFPFDDYDSPPKPQSFKDKVREAFGRGTTPAKNDGDILSSAPLLSEYKPSTSDDYTGSDLLSSMENYDPERFATSLSRENRLLRVIKDPVVQQGAIATFRTFVNAGITFADIVPGFGELASGAADIAKTVTRVVKYATFGKVNLPLDTTPDASLKLALGSEALELASFGFMPTHGLESARQLFADVPRMKAAAERIISIARNEVQDYETNQPEIDGAIDIFTI